MDTDRPSHGYYRACVGAWRAPIRIEVTDPSALAASGMTWADRAGLRLMAAWPRWLGTFWMEATVAYDPAGVVVHTTVARWMGLALMNSRETIMLDPDGRAFTMTGAQRVGLTSRSVSGNGTIGAEGRTAAYELRWLGAPLRQSTVLEGDVVTVTQEGPGFAGVQRLVRTDGR